MRIARRLTCRYKAVSSTHFPDLSLKSTLSRDGQIKTRPVWMPFDPERPYNDLPSLPPSQDVETQNRPQSVHRSPSGSGGVENFGTPDPEPRRLDKLNSPPRSAS